MYNTTITSNKITINITNSILQPIPSIILTSCSQSPFVKTKMNSTGNNKLSQRYPYSFPFQTYYKPGTTWKDLFGTGFIGSSAWAQPVDSLSEAAWNSQPGPSRPDARCGTGYEGSNAWAVQWESSGYDPTFCFTTTGTGSNGSIAGPNCGSGNLIPALSGTVLGTGSSNSIAGQECDNSGFVYESGRVLSMPTLGIWRTRLF
jgi:hypothetical protein